MKKVYSNIAAVLSIAALLLAGVYLFAETAFDSRIDFINLKQVGFLEAQFFQPLALMKMDASWSVVNERDPSLNPARIGIVDSGIDAQNGAHPEFRGVNLGNTPESVKRDSGERGKGHGTQIAGIIGANNLSATSAANYLPPHMNGVVSGILELPSSLEIRRALPFRVSGSINAVVQDGATVVNLSFGSIVTQPILRDIATRIYRNIFSNASGTLFIVAAGEKDGNEELIAPGNLGNDFDNVVTVSAIFDSGRLGAQTPEGSNFGDPVSLAAIGAPIYAPAPRGRGDFTEETKNYQTTFGGTSAAAPFVTGVAAILKSLEPEYQKYQPSGFAMTPAIIKDVLISSADPIDTDEIGKPLGKDCFKYNSSLHTGCRLNAHRAVAWFLPPASSTLSITTTTATSISLSWSLPNFDFLNPDFIKYELFRSTGTSNSFQSIATFDSSSTVSYTNSGLTPSTAYSYKLRTTDGAGLISDSAPVSATTRLAAPQPYVLNNRTIFYVNFDQPYEGSPTTTLPAFATSSGTIIPSMSLVFPELADDPSIPDTKDCRQVMGPAGIFSTTTGRFGLALHGEGVGSSFESFPALITCKNTKTQTIGTNTAHPDFTVGFWFKLDPSFILPQTIGSQLLIVPGLTNGIGSEVDRPFVANINHTATSNLGIVMNAVDTVHIQNQSLADNQWHNVIGVFNRTQGVLELFIDGAFRSSSTVPTHSQSAARGGITQYIGASFNGTGVLRGDLDDLWIEDHPWTPEEVGAYARGQQLVIP